MAHYLVTGGAGFIGSNLAHALVGQGRAGAHPRQLRDRARGEHRRARREEEGRADPRRHHRRARRWRAPCDGVDYVLHQAAIPSVPRSIEDPLGGDDINVHGTVTLLDAARKAGVKRLVFAASSSAYGEKAPGEPKVETMLPAPLSPYAAAKLAGEYYLQVFYHSYGLRDGGAALLQRLRAAPGSEVAVRGGDPELRDRGAAGAAGDHLRRRADVARLLLHRQRRRGEPLGLHRARRRRRGLQHRLRRVDLAARDGRDHRAHRRHEDPADPRAAAHRRHQVLARRHRQGEADPRLHRRVKFAEGIERTIAWYQKTL